MKRMISGTAPRSNCRKAASNRHSGRLPGLAGRVSPADTAEGVMRRTEMMEWIRELPEKEQTVIVARFGLDGSEAKTLEEIKRIPMRKPSGKYNVFNKITFSEGTSH